MTACSSLTIRLKNAAEAPRIIKSWSRIFSGTTQSPETVGELQRVAIPAGNRTVHHHPVLATGFYSETIFGFILKPFQINLNILSYIAGVGFFLHALINLYVYTMSKNHEMNSYKNQSLDNRFIAEFLRVGIHFSSFGIPITFPEQIFTEGNHEKERLVSENPKNRARYGLHQC